jgi:selenoprotein W-related protein
LKDELDVEAELKPGPSGSYEVAVDGKVVIRKASLAFPTDQEVVDAVARVLDA